MERVSSMDDIQKFWYEAFAGMKRSSSTSSLQQSIQPGTSTTVDSSAEMNSVDEDQTTTMQSSTHQNQDDVVETTAIESSSSSSRLYLVHNPNPVPPPGSKEFQDYLETILERSCTVVAEQVPSLNKEINRAVSQPSDSFHHPAHSKDSVILQDKDGGGGSSRLPAISNPSVAQVDSTASGEQSDGNEAVQSMDTTDKRERIKLLNRESARRSRERQKAHLSELEAQVSQSRVQNSSLQESHADIVEKKKKLATDNAMLKFQVEAATAKVRFYEEIYARVVGSNTQLQAMLGISTTGMPSFSGTSVVPVQDVPVQQFYHAPSSSQAWVPHGNGVVNILPQAVGSNNTVSMQSSHHLHAHSSSQAWVPHENGVVNIHPLAAGPNNTVSMHSSQHLHAPSSSQAWPSNTVSMQSSQHLHAPSSSQAWPSNTVSMQSSQHLHAPSSNQAWVPHENGVVNIPPQAVGSNNTVSMQSSHHLHAPSSSQAWVPNGNGVVDIPPQAVEPNNVVSTQSYQHLHAPSSSQLWVDIPPHAAWPNNTVSSQSSQHLHTPSSSQLWVDIPPHAAWPNNLVSTQSSQHLHAPSSSQLWVDIPPHAAWPNNTVSTQSSQYLHNRIHASSDTQHTWGF